VVPVSIVLKNDIGKKRSSHSCGNTQGSDLTPIIPNRGRLLKHQKWKKVEI